VYGGKNINSYGQVGLTKLRTASNGDHNQSGRRLGQGHTIDVVEQRSVSGMRTLASEKNYTAGYPKTTKVEVAHSMQKKGSGSLMDNIETILGEKPGQNKASFTIGIGSTRSTKVGGVTKPRRIPGNTKVVDVENLPSDISDDEWGEIQKFGHKLHEDQIRRQKAEHENRVK